MDKLSTSYTSSNSEMTIMFSEELPPKDDSPNNQLPTEILAKIFEYIPFFGKNWNAPTLVCRQWLKIFDDMHPFKILKRAAFNPSVLNGPISRFAKDKWELERINTMLGPWMNMQIKLFSDRASNLSAPEQGTSGGLFKRINTMLGPWMNMQIKLLFDRASNLSAPERGTSGGVPENNNLDTDNVSKIYDEEKITKKHENFISENLLFTIFDTDMLCPNEKVSSWLITCRDLHIKTYNPAQHLRQVILKLNLEEISSKIWEEVFRMHFLSLFDIPEKERTQAVCLAAVRQDGNMLRFVPEVERTQAVCLAAVQQNGRALPFVPEKERSQAMYLAAVQQEGRMLLIIPQIESTQAVCLAAVQQNGWALEYVPEVERTQAVCLAAVQQSGCALKFVPKVERTQAICLAAVQKIGWALKFVPEKEKTQAVCLAAVKQDKSALKFVPKSIWKTVIDHCSTR